MVCQVYGIDIKLPSFNKLLTNTGLVFYFNLGLLVNWQSQVVIKEDCSKYVYGCHGRKISQALKVSRDGASPTTLGNLF